MSEGKICEKHGKGGRPVGRNQSQGGKYLYGRTVVKYVA